MLFTPSEAPGLDKPMYCATRTAGRRDRLLLVEIRLQTSCGYGMSCLHLYAVLCACPSFAIILSFPDSSITQSWVIDSIVAFGTYSLSARHRTVEKTTPVAFPCNMIFTARQPRIEQIGISPFAPGSWTRTPGWHPKLRILEA